MSGNYRRTAFNAHGTSCAWCDSDENVEVHHRDGDRNNNDADNLLPLCRDCHRGLHRSGLGGLENELLPVDERSHIDPDTTTFGLRIKEVKWQAWKNTVPRSKSLEQRINELIRADTDGQVSDANLEDVHDDLERALEHREWSAVEDALARLEDSDA